HPPLHFRFILCVEPFFREHVHVSNYGRIWWQHPLNKFGGGNTNCALGVVGYLRGEVNVNISSELLALNFDRQVKVRYRADAMKIRSERVKVSEAQSSDGEIVSLLK